MMNTIGELCIFLRLSLIKKMDKYTQSEIRSGDVFKIYIKTAD
jgi:hypothetical protein